MPSETVAVAVVCTCAQVPTVLSLVVETCTADHLDTKALCSLVQVSAACRNGLQGSRGQHRVSINPAGAVVTGFPAWLAK